MSARPANGRMRGTHSLSLALAIAVFIASLAFIIFVVCGAARAHDAPPTQTQPLGWQYGWECCSGMDCRQIGADAVMQTPQGYVIKLTGEVIPYGDKRLKRSKDELYHQCTVGGDPKAVHSICLYVPDEGF